jgi:tripeptide aminopeptidase
VPDAVPELLPFFLELCAIPSPSGHERAVADRVVAYLRALGLEPEEDDAGPRIGGDTGNILVRLAPTPDGGGTPIFLCAHLDTVPLDGRLEPVVEDGYVRNAGGTILGADNKAAVCVMLEAVRRVLAEGREHAGIELLLTPKEETGIEGAKAFDRSRLVAPLGYVYDHAAPIGHVVQAAPTHRQLDVTFLGRKAHAGIAPEDGRSAIQAAARAIAELRLGRIDAATTANVGTIAGGTARNVIPDRCRVVAEARSLDEPTLLALVQEMVDTFTFAASVGECRVEIELEEKYRGYRFQPDDPIVRLAFAALARAGVGPQLVDCGGGADANAFNVGGPPCLNLANAMEDIHTPDERIAVGELERMVDVTLALVELARER